jgi:hypothetical protein
MGDFANGLSSPDSGDADQTLRNVGQKYKALAPHMANSVIVDSSGKPGAGDRHLEFYPPHETDNPRPGKITFELFDKMDQKQKEAAVAADALHHLGGYQDAEQTKPVDPTWLKMKNELMGMRSPRQLAIDANESKNLNPGDTPDAWLQRSRADAYIRGGLFPEQNPEWQEPGWFTPEQMAHFEKMRSYLKNGATEPPPFVPDPSADRDQAIKRQFNLR